MDLSPGGDVRNEAGRGGEALFRRQISKAKPKKELISREVGERQRGGHTTRSGRAGGKGETVCGRKGSGVTIGIKELNRLAPLFHWGEKRIQGSRGGKGKKSHARSSPGEVQSGCGMASEERVPSDAVLKNQKNQGENQARKEGTGRF